MGGRPLPLALSKKRREGWGETQHTPLAPFNQQRVCVGGAAAPPPPIGKSKRRCRERSLPQPPAPCHKLRKEKIRQIGRERDLHIHSHSLLSHIHTHPRFPPLPTYPLLRPLLFQVYFCRPERHVGWGEPHKQPKCLGKRLSYPGMVSSTIIEKEPPRSMYVMGL